MAYADDVPLICDAPPRRCYVLKVKRPISADTAARLKRLWQDFAMGTSRYPLMVLDEDVEVIEIGGCPPGGPDAEFCAA